MSNSFLTMSASTTKHPRTGQLIQDVRPRAAKPLKRPFGPRVQHASGQQLSIVTVQHAKATPKLISDVVLVAPEPYARPAHSKQQPSRVLHRRGVQKPGMLVHEEILYLEPVPKKISGVLALFSKRRLTS